MKKILTLIIVALTLHLNAQQFVSTTPQNRNVVIEEFTGINCPNCPDGHVVANNIMDAYPGRVWAVNIHAGNYAPMYYPNLTRPTERRYIMVLISLAFRRLSSIVLQIMD